MFNHKSQLVIFLAVFARTMLPSTAQAQNSATEPSTDRGLQERSTIHGGTGLLRTLSAQSSKAGVFRITLLADFYKGRDFLCRESAPCLDNVRSDRASHFGTTLGLSVTPLTYLETHATLRSSLSHLSESSPQSIFTFGDLNLGLKMFTPDLLERVFAFGGAADLSLLNAADAAGPKASATSARLRALGTADLREVTETPLRIHLNTGYFLDNSSQIARPIETERGSPISRLERFGHGMSRVDRFEIGLGTEARFAVAAPFLEWNVGIPVNRQGYTCTDVEARFPGDGCLMSASFSELPSALSGGVRIFPELWNVEIFAALDVATSGSRNFIEELAPTVPWAAWLGFSYAIDVVPPPPQIVEIERPVPIAPPPLHKLCGLVLNSVTREPVPGAVVSFPGDAPAPAASDAEGRFVSAVLDPGTVELLIEAPGYEPGRCEVTIDETREQEESAFAAEDPARLEQKIYLSSAECELEPLPKAAKLTGRILVLEDTLLPIAEATVTLVDADGGTLVATTGPDGSFQFEEAPLGRVHLNVESEGHVPIEQVLEFSEREQETLEITLQPARPSPRRANPAPHRNPIDPVTMPF